MPERRKRPDEVIDLDERRAAGDTDEAADDESAQFVAITDEDRKEANEAFRTLIAEGYVPNGPFDLHGDAQGRKMVTLSVILPHTLGAGDSDGE